MKNYLLFLFVISFLFSCTVKTGSGNLVEEPRNVESFHAVSVGQGISLVISEGSTQTVRVSADDNLIGLVTTKVVDGELKIQFEDKVSLMDANITVYITNAGHINSLSTGSGSEVKTEGVMKHENFIHFNLSSGSRMEINVDAPEINVDASSGSDAELNGVTRKLIASASSGSSIDAVELKAEAADLSASSGSSVAAFASISVSGKASSGGSVSYSGPDMLKLTTSESSGGTVRKK